MKILQVNNISDPRITEFINMKKVDEKHIVISSKKALDKALSNNIEIDKILINKEFLAQYKDNKLDIKNILTASKKILQEIVGYKLHQGIFALATRPDYEKISQLNEKIIIFNGITSPENIGSLTRSASAFGFNSIIFDSKSCSPYMQRCIRVSMGNIFSVKVYKSESLIKDLEKLKDLNYKIISTANIENSINIDSFNAPKKIALIIGSEGHGIDKEILEFSDETIKIPIDDQTLHLNASIAGAISMYQLSK